MTEAVWHVLNVAPQREMRVAIDLRRQGLLAMLPTERRYRKTRGKGNRPVIMAYSHPVIPSYVFVGSDHAMNWPAIAKVEHVRGYITFDPDGEPARLTPSDIAIIRRLGLANKSTGGQALRIGDMARLTEGPLWGIEGVVEAIGRERVTVRIMLFGSMRIVSERVDRVERSV